QHCTGRRGEDPRASAKPVRLCQAGVEGHTRRRGGTDPFAEDGGVASRERLRSNRPTDPNRSGPGTRLPSEAGLCRGARAGPTRWPAAAETYGRAPSEAARSHQDHDGEINPADRRGTNRETVSQSRGPQFLLGRRRRDAQVLRGHPRGPATSGDPERSEDQLDLRTGEPRTRVPGPHVRGQERPRPDAQGQGRGKDSAEYQPPRATRQVTSRRSDSSREASDLFLAESDDRFEDGDVEERPIFRVERLPTGPEEDRFGPRDPNDLAQVPVRGKAQYLEANVPFPERLGEALAIQHGHRDSATALHPHPGGDHARFVPDHRQGPALAAEREASRTRPDFLEHERAVVADLDVDLDVGMGEIHSHVRMGPADFFPQVAAQVLTRERVGSHPPRSQGERLTRRQGTESLREDDLPEGV